MTRHEQIGNRIKDRRKELKMSQKDLGNMVGLTSATISRIEDGSRTLTQENITKFTQALEVSPDWLMGWSDQPQISRIQLAQHVLSVLENMQVTVEKEDPMLARLMGYINLMNDDQKQKLIDYAEFISERTKKDPDQS